MSKKVEDISKMIKMAYAASLNMKGKKKQKEHLQGKQKIIQQHHDPNIDPSNYNVAMILSNYV